MVTDEYLNTIYNVYKNGNCTGAMNPVWAMLMLIFLFYKFFNKEKIICLRNFLFIIAFIFVRIWMNNIHDTIEKTRQEYDEIKIAHYDEYKGYIIDAKYSDRKIILLKDHHYYYMYADCIQTVLSDVDPYIEVKLDENGQLTIIKWITYESDPDEKELPLIVT